MPPPRKTRPPIVDDDAADPRTDAEKIADGSVSSALSELLDLEVGETIAVTRVAPSYAKGWLEDMLVPDGGVSDVPEQIRQSYGGGTFVLQAKRRTQTSGNRLAFTHGASRITIGGEPLHQGRRYVNGRLIEDNPPVTSPVIMQAPNPSSSSGDQLQRMLLGLVERSLTQGGSSKDNPIDVVRLVSALQTTLGQGQADPFGNLERTLSLIGTLRKTFGDTGAPSRRNDDDDDGGGSMFGSSAMLEKMIMAKVLGGNGGGGLFGGPPQPPPQVPPGMIWHPARGWIPDPYAQPYGQPPPYAPPSPPTAPPTAAQPEPTPTPAEPIGDDDEEGEFEPLTVDDIVSDLAVRSPEEQHKFLSSLVARLGGVDVAEVEAAFDQIGSTAPNLVNLGGAGGRG